MWRQGDILLAAVEDMPKGRLERKAGNVLAQGELTGHSHRIEPAEAAELWWISQYRGELILKIVGQPAQLVHEEHRPIKLMPGLYRVWCQREYTPDEIVHVRD